MDRAAGETPEQITIDRAEQQFATHRPLTRTGHIVENPCDLGAGEIRVHEQSGFSGDQRLMPFRLQPGAAIGSAPNQPNNGAMDRLPARTIPHDHRLALDADADGREVARCDIALSHRLVAGRDRRRPDIFRLVLDPTRGRKMLLVFLLCARRDGEIAAKQHRAGGCRALIDGKKVSHRAAYCTISNNPAEPMPPPTHIVATAYFDMRRRPSISKRPASSAT